MFLVRHCATHVGRLETWAAPIAWADSRAIGWPKSGSKRSAEDHITRNIRCSCCLETTLAMTIFVSSCTRCRREWTVADLLPGKSIRAFGPPYLCFPARRSVDAAVAPDRYISLNKLSTIDEDTFQPVASSLQALWVKGLVREER